MMATRSFLPIVATLAVTIVAEPHAAAQSCGTVDHHDSTSSDDVGAIGGGLVAALVLPAGPLRFRAELLGGGQLIAATVTSTFEDCTLEESYAYRRFLLEARGGIRWFVDSWLSLDAWGGADLVNPGNFGGGIGIAVHARSFDAID